MRYAKLINENEIEELNQDYLVIDGVVYTNPLHNGNINIKALGYKEFVIDEMPSCDMEEEKVVRYYQDKDNAIHRSWRVEKLTNEEKEMRKLMMGV